MTQPLPRLLILPALAVLLALAIPASPASAGFTPLPAADCPCWGDGGPFYSPASWCYDLGSTRFGFQPGMFAQTVTYGAVSYCRKNGSFSWTSPAEHAACNAALHLACSPLLAVAYIDRNDNDVFDRTDGLIAKLVDTNGDGSVNPGDALVLDVFPRSPLTPAALGEFAVKTEPIIAVLGVPSSFDVRIETPTVKAVLFGKPIPLDTIPFETFDATDTIQTQIIFRDFFQSANADWVLTRPTSPWGLTPTTTDTTTVQPGDQPFLDVDIFLPPAPF